MAAKEVTDSPADEHYKKLLEQQTLYLQLQVMQQNALMAALQGNDDKDSADGNQEPFRERTSSSVSSNSQPYSPSSLCALEDMKVAELKSELKLRGLPVSGQKAKLIERLRSFDEKNSINANGNVSPTQCNMQSEAVPSSPDAMATSVLQTSMMSQNTMSSTVPGANQNVVCVASTNGLSYQVIQSSPRIQQQMSQGQTFAAGGQPLQQINYAQNGHMTSAATNGSPVAPQLASQVQYVKSAMPMQGIPNRQPAPFPQRQSSSPAGIQLSNTTFPMQIVSNSNQVIANGSVPNSGQSQPSVPVSPVYSSFLGTIGGQQVIIHSLNPQQTQQLQQQQQQQIKQNLQSHQIQQQQQQQQNMRLSGSLPDLQQLKCNQHALQQPQQQQPKPQQPLMKLESQQWIKQPGIPVSDDNAFMMFKLKPETKGRMSCNKQNSRTPGNNGCVNNKDVSVSMPQNHNNNCNTTVATTAVPTSCGFSNSMMCNEMRTNPSTQNGASNEDLLDILGELSPPIEGFSNDLLRGQTMAPPQIPTFTPNSRMLKAEPPSYVAACASLGKGNDPSQSAQSNSGSVPHSLNLFGMDNRNSPIADYVDDPFRQRSESTPCKPVSKLHIQEQTPMNIDDDTTQMDVDDFISNGSADMNWLDLSFSPGTSPQTQQKRLPPGHLSMKEQLFHVSLPTTELSNHNMFPYNSPKVSGEQPVSIFDLDTCGMMNDTNEMERWDIY